MKKTAIAAALALSLGASLAHAQTIDPRGWYAGYARTRVSGNGGSDDANSGVFGLGAYYELNRQWFLKAGWDHYTKVAVPKPAKTRSTPTASASATVSRNTASDFLSPAPPRQLGGPSVFPQLPRTARSIH